MHPIFCAKTSHLPPQKVRKIMRPLAPKPLIINHLSAHPQKSKVRKNTVQHHTVIFCDISEIFRTPFYHILSLILSTLRHFSAKNYCVNAPPYNYKIRQL